MFAPALATPGDRLIPAYREATLPRVLIPLGDFLIIAATLFFGVQVLTGVYPDATLAAHPGALAWMGPWVILFRIAFLAGLYFFFLSRAGLYRHDRLVPSCRNTAICLWASLEAFVCMATLALLFRELVAGRNALLAHGATAIPLLALWRLVVGKYFAHKPDPRPTVVLGAGRFGSEIADALTEHGSSVVGLVRVADQEAVDSKYPVLGEGNELLEICRRHRVGRILLAPSTDTSGRYPMNELIKLGERGVEIVNGVQYYEENMGRVLYDVLSPDWWVAPAEFRRSLPERIFERTLSILIGGLALIVLSPLLAVVALLVKLDSAGPVFFRQERVGLGGKPFGMLKFRTMRTDAEAKTGPVWCKENDPRVTRIGRILRRTRIDELPQFWNVLRGQMALVGPRPERPHFVSQLEKSVPLYQFRHIVPPGITGWAQVNHGYASTDEDASMKLRYDLYYLKHASPRLILEVLLGSVITVISGRGAR